MTAKGGIGSRRNKAPPNLHVEQQNFDKSPGYTLDNDAFIEGDLTITKTGLSITSANPVTPDAKKDGLPSESPRPVHHSIAQTPTVEEEQYNIRFSDLQVIRQLGRGSGGVVQCVLYKPKRKLMAMKVIPLDVTDQVRKQILLELRTLYQSQSPSIVKFYGGFFTDGHIQICLELMDGDSLEGLLRKIGPFPEPVIASIASQVLRGLVYLHKEKKLVHRDIKPSNILINSKGEVKISDFGVSGQLASSISSCVSWVGTVTYMSPERIQGHSYSVQSDIWSFGLSMVELALGYFPYHSPEQALEHARQLQNEMPTVNKPEQGEEALGFWELLSLIVEKDIPDVPASKYSVEFKEFCQACLKKSPSERMTAMNLLEHPYLKKSEGNRVDMAAWVRPYITKYEEDLVAQLPSATQANFPPLESTIAASSAASASASNKVPTLSMPLSPESAASPLSKTLNSEKANKRSSSSSQTVPTNGVMSNSTSLEEELGDLGIRAGSGSSQHSEDAPDSPRAGFTSPLRATSDQAGAKEGKDKGRPNSFMGRFMKPFLS